MGDHADDLALKEAGLDRVPDGKWFVYRHNGVRYEFKTLEEARRWARSKGFDLTDKPPKKDKS